MKNLAAWYGISATPDIFSVTPGFWGLLRMGDGDEKERIRLLASGVPAEKLTELEPWSEMSTERTEWLTVRTEEAIRKVAGIWENEPKPPRVIWRPLHHIRNDTRIPNHRIRIYNSIGERIIEKLHAETEFKSKIHRDPWPTIMLGQEEHFVDSVHPEALPGSWIYWQSLLLQLKLKIHHDEI